MAGVDDLLNTAPCGFLSFTDDGTVRLVNATLLEMLGYDRAELVDQHVETIFGVGSRIFYQTHLFPLVRLHGGAEEIFLLLRAKSGEDVGVLTNVTRREQGGVQYNHCIFMRVRERRRYEEELLRAKQAAERARAELERQKRELEHANELLELQAIELEQQQEQLQDQAAELEAASEALQATNEDLERQREVADEANRAKSNFLAVMSHELRTPLNAIAGYVQILELGIHGPITEAQREALGRVERNQRHLLRLINDVLNLARIESGRVDYQVEDISLPELVNEMAAMVEPMLNAKRLVYTAKVDSGLRVRADREKLRQILLNLLSNAIKFTPTDGRIEVRSAAAPEGADRVLLEIQDTGIGIAPEKLDSVFEPFVQVDVSRTRQTEGTGLGLSISRELAQGMGGDLRASSRPGEGSTFTLVLPRAGTPD